MEKWKVDLMELIDLVLGQTMKHGFNPIGFKMELEKVMNIFKLPIELTKEQKELVSEYVSDNHLLTMMIQDNLQSDRAIEHKAEINDRLEITKEKLGIE